MIISENSRPPIGEFTKLLEALNSSLKLKSKKTPSAFIGCDPGDFEKEIVFTTLKEVAKDTPFNGHILHIGGHKFPDIVVKDIYGVEVKTTKQNKWTSTGNSVFESTRVVTIEKIFIFFAKLARPIDFKYKPYQDCLEDIAVTHSPRYLIDMELPVGTSIFDKMGIDYETLRNLSNPVATFREYYKKTKPGEEPWWLGSPTDPDESELVKPVIQIFGDLPIIERDSYIAKAMVLFPEVFSNKKKKYMRVAQWLAGRYGIIDWKLRDNFSANGQVSIQLGSNKYQSIPKIYKVLKDNIEIIFNYLNNAKSADLDYYWGESDPVETNVNRWCKYFLENSQTVMKDNKKFLINLIGFHYPGELPNIIREECERYGVNL